MPHTQLLSAIWQVPSARFQPAAPASTLPSHPQAEQALGAGGTRGKRNYSAEGETTHQPRSQHSVMRIMSGDVQK